MKINLTSIYEKFPIWAQNFLISVYGLKVNNIRHRGNYKKYFIQAQQMLSSSSDKLDEYQLSVLLKMLKSAVSNVSYYKVLHKKGLFPFEKITSLNDLKFLPLLEKSFLREDSNQFVDETFPANELITLNTTGTTGTPLKIVCSADVRQKNFAFYDRFLVSSGINIHGKRATLGGRIVVPASNSKPPFWRYSYFQKNMLFSSYHLSDENMDIYIKKLRQYNPDFIDSYPSSIYSIAEYAIRNNIDLTGVTKAITTSGETLFVEQKEIIENAFGVKVFDQYGAAEMCVFVGQCSEGRYHLHSDFGIVELLNDKGEPSQPGEIGEVVCTGFVNNVMPLIRYRIGDSAIATDKSCSCGLPFPIVEKVLGREDDVIITPEGNKVGRLSPVMKGFPIIESQYVQYSKDAVDVLLIKADGYTSESEVDIIKELRKRLGSEINIIIRYVTELPRGKGGKLKSIISYVSI